MNRRDFLQTSAAALPFLTLAGKASAQQTQAAAVPFGPAYVRQIARDLATKSYQAPDEKLPDSLKDLEKKQQERSKKAAPTLKSKLSQAGLSLSPT